MVNPWLWLLPTISNGSRWKSGCWPAAAGWGARPALRLRMPKKQPGIDWPTWRPLQARRMRWALVVAAGVMLGARRYVDDCDDDDFQWVSMIVMICDGSFNDETIDGKSWWLVIDVTPSTSRPRLLADDNCCSFPLISQGWLVNGYRCCISAPTQ